jgi:hypothetical protein
VGAARGDPAPNQVGVAVAAEHAQLRDDLVLPFRATGPGGGLVLSYARTTAAAAHRAALDVGGAFLTNRFDQESIHLRLAGRYEYGRSLRGAPAFALGGLLRGSDALQYHADWDDAHLYWLTAYDAGPFARFEHDLGPGRFAVQLSTALLALVSRPPEYRFNKQDALRSPGFLLGKSHEALSVASMNRYQAAELRFGYTRPWGPRTTWSVTYTLDVRRYDRPRLVALLSQTLALGVQRAF